MVSTAKAPANSTTVAGVGDTSLVEALPQDILIRVICNVEHDDLKQLIRVSKTISEATLIAKQFHFSYCTPSSKKFVNSIDLKNAPSRRRFRTRLHRKLLAQISVALFAEED